MILAKPSMIPQIDSFAEKTLGIPVLTLMQRAGEAVAKAVSSLALKDSRIRVFAGKGNNGGDGYAAALMLMQDHDVKVYDVFGAGQRSSEGKYFLDAFINAGGVVDKLDLIPSVLDDIASSDCFIDAVFGTGFVGKTPEKVAELAAFLRTLEGKKTVAIDVPVGVNSDDGSIDKDAIVAADITVSLGVCKPGLVSYPAKEYVGKLEYDNIGLQIDDISSVFEFSDYLIDNELARSILPHRPQNSNKGTFGKLLLMSGSERFPGAAHLSLEAALRGGVGYVTYLGTPALCDTLVEKLPEAIYKPMPISNLSDSDLAEISALETSHTAVLLGSGSGKSDALYALTKHLLLEIGVPLILDADAINVLADDAAEGRELIRNSPRTVILTPHPLEFSRISGIPVDEVQSARLRAAKAFAKEQNCILALKGAGTVVTDGDTVYINSSGSSALAKAGSGDVLAGFLSSLVSFMTDPLLASALAVYLHGIAADVLAKELSEFGVLPSDLPREIGRQIAKLGS